MLLKLNEIIFHLCLGTHKGAHSSYLLKQLGKIKQKKIYGPIYVLKRTLHLLRKFKNLLQERMTYIL